MSYTHLSQLDLFTQVQDVSLALCALGLQPGQILGYYGPTSTASVVLLLAASVSFSLSLLHLPTLTPS